MPEPMIPPLPAPPPARQSARFAFRAGRVKMRASVEVTPLGMLAIGGLVSAILLSSAVIVKAATDGAARIR
jgi:hypothetical protein